LEYAIDCDHQFNSKNGKRVKHVKHLFDHYVNFLPQQGSRTIRTEEALFIGLTAIKHYVW